MSLTRIIVLANSWKNQDWCIAGIEPTTGKWVRPVTSLDDGRVRKIDMKTDAHSLQLLDILDIPLNTTGPDFGFESENRTILPGQWHLHGQANVKDVLKHAERPYYILHNAWKYVTLDEMRVKAFEERTTLQLIRVDNFTIRDTRSETTDKHNWRGTVSPGGRILDLPITDPAFCERLTAGHEPSKSCLLTMSLSMPHKPQDWGADDPPAYWKLVAGVIEL